MNQEHPEEIDRHLAVLKAEVARRSPDNELDTWAVERALARLNRRGSVARPWWRPVRWATVPAAGVLLVTAAVSAKLWTGKATTSADPEESRPVAATSHILRRGPGPSAGETPAPPSIVVEVGRGGGREPDHALSPNGPRPQTAASLFDRARDLAREGKLDAAIAMHLRLQKGFPDTPEAALSFALSGRLLLERGRAAAALAQFDRHLARGGGADEEALAGRAAALAQLGRQSDEVRAWRTLLERHPGSVYADRAKVRLRDLSAR